MILVWPAAPDYEITFAGTVVQIVDILPLSLAFPDEVYSHDRFKTMPQVLTGKRIPNVLLSIIGMSFWRQRYEEKS